MIPSDRNARGTRPRSEMLQTGQFASSDVEQHRRWQAIETSHDAMLKEISVANQDQTFKDELQHVDQWFRYLSEHERTATMYKLLQNATPTQAHFYMSVLCKSFDVGNGFRRATPFDQGFPPTANMSSQFVHSDRAIGGPMHTGSRPGHRGVSNTARHSLALGDVDEYYKRFESVGLPVNPVKYPNATDEFGRDIGMRSASHMYGNNGRRGSGEEDASLLLSSRPWVNLPTKSLQNVATPRAPNISRWSLGSAFENLHLNSTSGGSSSSHRGLPHHGWDVPTAMQLGHTDKDKRDMRYSVHGSTRTIRSDAPMSSAKATTMGDTANVKGVSTTRHHAGLPALDKQSHAPDLALHDDRSSHSDYSETSSVSTDHHVAQPHPSGKHPNGKPSLGGTSFNSVMVDKKDADTVNMELLKDIPAWLRKLRLHKYNDIFGDMKWQDMIKLSNEDLEAKGVSALGARRKMLRAFESIRDHCDAINIDY